MCDEYESPVLLAAQYVERIVRRAERFGDAHPATVYDIELALDRFEEETRPLMRELDERGELGPESEVNVRRIIEVRMQLKRVNDAHPHPLLESALDEITAWIEG